MTNTRLALKLLWRNWRSGELSILAGAVILAVAVVTAIAVFADRMDRSLKRQSHSYLAADRQVTSRFPIPAAWQDQAQEKQLRQSQIIEFASMVYAEEEMTLASVKAVAPGYPLRGNLQVSDQPFASAEQISVAQDIPPPGQVWVDSRLLPMMNLQLGQRLWVGEHEFEIGKVLMHEPDGTQGFSVTGPRVMMNVADLAATEVVQPGSRIRYRWLLAGAETELDSFASWLEPELGDHYRWLTLEESQQNLSGALDRGKSFLMLAGMIGVLLAGVAIAMAAQQFARVNQDTVALLKSLGTSKANVRYLYFGQLLLLGLFATLIGLMFGDVLQRIIAASLSSLVEVELLGSAAPGYWVGLAAGMVCLLCFALPPLWALPTLPPIRILRSEVEMIHLNMWLQGSLGLLGVIMLIGIYSFDLRLTLTVIAGLLTVVVLAALIGLVLLKGTQQIGARAGSIWRLAVANLIRNGKHSVTQLVVFAIAIMLMLVLYIVRTDLITDWRTQLPDDAPNHFLLNMAPHETDDVVDEFNDNNYSVSPIYPMILGRLVAHNEHRYQESDRTNSFALRREANLSWAEKLPADNKILEGLWWDEWQGQGHGVSVERDTAKGLSLNVGDKLVFSIGGLELPVTVASIRSVDWNAMTPNFYFLFSPGALDEYSPTYMTSAYVPSDNKQFISELIREHPTMIVIEVDRVIERIKAIIAQVSKGLELVLWVVLLGGVLVLMAAVNASMHSRLHETSILRALGSGRRLIVGSLCLEFSLLGLCAGIMAVMGAELLLFCLQVFVFESPAKLHFKYWALAPVIAALFIGLLGAFACRKTVTVPPALVLRELKG